MSRIVLIGCGKAKREERSEAADLYTGSLFQAAREYAESTADSWYILSGLHGLLLPEVEIEPYEAMMKEKLAVDRAAWHVGVVAQLLDELPEHFDELRSCVLEVHAGVDYREPLMSIAREAGFACTSPTAELQLGERIAWLKEEARRNRILNGINREMEGLR